MLKKVTTSTGTRAMTIQAPPANLVMAMSSMTTAEAAAPRPFTTDFACQWRPRFLNQCTTMPVWLMVKPRNTPRAYSGSRTSVLAWNRKTRAPESSRQDQDAVGEHQPVAHAGELLGQEAVLGVQRGQPREVRVGGVGRHHQDGEGEALDQVVVEPGQAGPGPRCHAQNRAG